MSTLTITQASCADDYDPDSMPVAKARAFIHQFLTPVTGVLRVRVTRAAHETVIASQLGDGRLGNARGRPQGRCRDHAR